MCKSEAVINSIAMRLPHQPSSVIMIGGFPIPDRSSGTITKAKHLSRRLKLYIYAILAIRLGFGHIGVFQCLVEPVPLFVRRISDMNSDLVTKVLGDLLQAEACGLGPVEVDH